MGAITTSPVNVLAAPDWHATDLTLRRMLDLDLHLRREELKAALREYEKAHKGHNLVGSKVYEFLRHVQNIVWKELAALAMKDPDEYQAWKRGKRGHWSMETNNLAHGVLLRLSENERMERHRPGADKDVKRRKNGMTALDDNLRRTVQNWRRKTTARWQCQNGDVLEGFPFFLNWTRLNRAGQPDPKGRGNVVGLVNMRWIFGPEWVDHTIENPAENEVVTESDTENISRIPQHLETAKEKKEEMRYPALPDPGIASPLEAAIEPDLSTARQQEHPLGASEQILEEKFFAAGAAPSGGGEAAGRAAGLWRLLWLHVYLPLMTTGRIRFSAEIPFERPQFRSYVAAMAIPKLIKHLALLKNPDETTLEGAEARLKLGIKAQAKYLKDNPEVWILHPEKFLCTERTHGTLLSALRLWVNEPQNLLPTPPPEPDEPHTDEMKRLYNRLIELGATTTYIGTFRRWYLKFGAAHITECLKTLEMRRLKLRAQGKPVGHEFAGNQGGASAYFARLIGQVKEPVVSRQTRFVETKELRGKLRQNAATHYAANRAEWDKLKSSIQENPALAASWLAMMNEYFGLNQKKFSDVIIQDIVLIDHILKVNSSKP